MPWHRSVLFVVLAAMLAACGDRVADGHRALVAGDTHRAATIWMEEAYKGEPAAQYNMGLMFERGVAPVERSRAAALSLFMKAGNQGYLPAMNAAGRILREDHRLSEAATWYTLAARWGDEPARTALASMGISPPPADLQQGALLANSAPAIDPGAGYMAGQLLGCSLGGGCGAPAPTYSAPPASRSPGYTMCPDGTFAGGSRCVMAPNGRFVGNM